MSVIWTGCCQIVDGSGLTDRGEGDGGVERVEGRALPSRVGPVEGPGPAQAEFMVRVLVVVPYGPSVTEDERAVGRLAALQPEFVQVAHKKCP